MKNLQIYEPAMCCSTGLCGVGVDPELLRISTVIDTLSKNDIIVERFNLSSAPQAFVTNKVVNQFIKDNGVEQLPVVTVDGEIVIEGRYPNNAEFTALLNLQLDLLGEDNIELETCGCDDNEDCCSGGCCC